MNLVSKKLSRVVRDFFVNQHLVSQGVVQQPNQVLARIAPKPTLK